MNLDTNKKVPFKFPEIGLGFKEGQGLMRCHERGLALEFEVKGAILGLMSSGIKNVLIPYSDLESVTYKKGWIGAEIILEGVSMKVFDDIPGTELASCVLKIKRKHRDQARAVVSEARLHLSEYRLKQLDAEG